MPPAHLTPWGSFYLEAPPPDLSAHLKAPFGHHLLCESSTGPLTGLQAVRCPLFCPHTMPPGDRRSWLPHGPPSAGLGTHPEPGKGLQSQQLYLAVLGAPGCQCRQTWRGAASGSRGQGAGSGSCLHCRDTSRRPAPTPSCVGRGALPKERAAPTGPRGAALPG